MKTNFSMFEGCSSVNELKLRNEELSGVFSGQKEMLNTISAEYNALMESLSPVKPEIPVKEKASVSEKIKELQGKIDPVGLRLEICGSWLWVTGPTYKVKDILKDLGFRYSANKFSWYYRPFNQRSGNQEPIPLELIREKYGASVVNL